MAKKSFTIFDSSKVRRILPIQVKEAYDKTGFKPIVGKFFMEVNGSKCCCAMSAYFCSNKMDIGLSAEEVWNFFGKTEHPVGFDLENYEDFHPSYIAGFIRGFDGGDLPELSTNEFKMGIVDGKDSYKLVRGER